MKITFSFLSPEGTFGQEKVLDQPTLQVDVFQTIIRAAKGGGECNIFCLYRSSYMDFSLDGFFQDEWS